MDAPDPIDHKDRMFVQLWMHLGLYVARLYYTTERCLGLVMPLNVNKVKLYFCKNDQTKLASGCNCFLFCDASIA